MTVQELRAALSDMPNEAEVRLSPDGWNQLVVSGAVYNSLTGVLVLFPFKGDKQ